MTKQCGICEQALDVPGEPSTLDCGGDCRACMADAGDSECATAELAHLRIKLTRYKAAYDVWQDKTDWVQKDHHWSELGMHRADVLKRRIETLEGDMKLAKKAARLVAVRECRDMFIPGTVSYKALDEKLVAETDKPVEL